MFQTFHLVLPVTDPACTLACGICVIFPLVVKVLLIGLVFSVFISVLDHFDALCIAGASIIVRVHQAAQQVILRLSFLGFVIGGICAPDGVGGPAVFDLVAKVGRQHLFASIFTGIVQALHFVVYRIILDLVDVRRHHERLKRPPSHVVIECAPGVGLFVPPHVHIRLVRRVVHPQRFQQPVCSGQLVQCLSA